MRWFLATLCCILAIALAPTDARAQTDDQPTVNREWLQDNYTKTEVMVPMRDGVKLHTAIYAPKDLTTPRPIIMIRTPYSCRPYGEENFRNSIGPSPAFALDNYIVVYQDVRGCYMSEGTFINMTPHKAVKRTTADIDESTDCYDTIEWLVNNVEGNNGHVGLWGISYPGFYAASSMIDAHPALKASSPQAPIADWWYDDFHHHGAFFLPHSFWFISSFGQPRPEPTTTRPGRSFDVDAPDGYQFFLDVGPLKNLNDRYLQDAIPFWNALVEHPNRDEFWESRDIIPHLNNVAPAVMTVGGWFDAEDLYGPLSIYQSIEQKNPDSFNILVMGPWDHGGWARRPGDRLGDAHFGTAHSPGYRADIEKPFFDYFLKGEGTLTLPEATVFETGANQWREFTDWPPPAASPRTLHLHDDGTLSFTAPIERGSNDFISDPDHPVPFTRVISSRMPKSYMTEDQRFASRRPDVLVYQTAPLTEPLTIAGPILADLVVSTTGTDADWIVKLIDVHPNDHPDYPDISPDTRTAGMQMMVRSEVIRGRFRNDPAHPEPFVPDEPTSVPLPLQDVLHTFKPGHRIMIQIQSTWFPLVDRNPQTFVPNIFLAEESDFQKATHRVHTGPDQGTKIEILTLPQK